MSSLVHPGDVVIAQARGAWHRAVVQAVEDGAVRVFTEEQRVFVLPLRDTPLEIIEPADDENPSQPRGREHAGPEAPPPPLPNPRDYQPGQVPERDEPPSAPRSPYEG